MSTHKFQIRSRHPTHHAIADKLPRMPWPVIARFGSETYIGGTYVELNTPQACRTSADKLLMKRAFTFRDVPTAQWYHADFMRMLHDTIQHPVVAKFRNGSRGTGVYLLETQRALKDFITSRKDRLNDYIFEDFLNYDSEYRCHTWAGGVFNTSRKALRQHCPRHMRWKFCHEHTVWLREANPHFEKPKTWDEIEKACILATKACGLAFGGVDVKVDQATGKFFIIEINSAPSFGDLTAEAYTKQLPIIAEHQHKHHGLATHTYRHD